MRNPVPFRFLILGTKCPFPSGGLWGHLLVPQSSETSGSQESGYLVGFLNLETPVILHFWEVFLNYFLDGFFPLILCAPSGTPIVWMLDHTYFPAHTLFFRSPLLFPHLFTRLSGRASHLYLSAVMSSSHLCTQIAKNSLLSSTWVFLFTALYSSYGCGIIFSSLWGF